MFQMILVPWDASELCGPALSAAVELASEYEAEIVVLSVLTGAGPDRDAVVATFDEARAAARSPGLGIRHEIVDGAHPAHDLHAFAHEHGFDLIVVGHHRDHHPSVLRLHGVTEHLVAESEIPVLVIPCPP